MCVTSELQHHRYGGSWASSFTPILQEQMDERVWQKRTLCTAATTAAAPHSRIPCILQAHEHQVGEEEGEKKKHVCTHTTQQLHRCFFFDEKRRGRVGGETRNNNKKKTKMESDTSSGIRGAYFLVLASIHDNSCLDRACIWRSSASWWEQCLN